MENIVKMGNPLLRKESQLVTKEEFNSSELKSWVRQLLDSMKQTKAVGVAAPQIGIMKRIIVFGSEHSRRKSIEPFPTQVLINPEIYFFSNDMVSDYEGCLSVGELMAKVPRSNHINYSGYNLEGEAINASVCGLQARVIQHEYDHLEGILFVDRVLDTKSMTLYSEFIKQE